MSPDLLGYWNFSDIVDQNINLNPISVAPSYAKNELNTNIYNTVNKNSSSTLYNTGGAFGGGYIAANSRNKSGNNFHIYGGLGDMSTTEDRGFAISMQTKANATGQVSFSFNFSGSADDSTFIITNNSVTLGGIASGVWNIVASSSSLSANDWSSLVFSVNNDGIANIYLGGTLFANTSGSLFDNAQWAGGNSRWRGNIAKFGLGSKINGSYGATESSFSDLALWDKSLSAEDAAFLANNSAISLGAVPEPGAAALSLLGASMFLFRRKIRA